MKHFPLYFVAVRNPESREPDRLVAGPFVDFCAAVEAEEQGRNYCIVKTLLPFDEAY
jgi:hypothetical protein